MDSKQKLLDWKKVFLQRVEFHKNKPELEKEYEPKVMALTGEQLDDALRYHQLWENARTDADKFYFSQKTIETIFGHKL